MVFKGKLQLPWTVGFVKPWNRQREDAFAVTHSKL